MPIFSNLFDFVGGNVLSVITFKNQLPGKDVMVGPSVAMGLDDLKALARVLNEAIRRIEEAGGQGQTRQ